MTQVFFFSFFFFLINPWQHSLSCHPISSTQCSIQLFQLHWMHSILTCWLVVCWVLMSFCFVAHMTRLVPIWSILHGNILFLTQQNFSVLCPSRRMTLTCSNATLNPNYWRNDWKCISEKKWPWCILILYLQNHKLEKLTTHVQNNTTTQRQLYLENVVVLVNPRL